METIDQIKEMWSEGLVRLHNDYCNESGNMDDYIYDNDPDVIDEMFSSVSEAMRAVTYGDWNPHHPYFQFNGYANIESFEAYNINDRIDEALLAEWVEENESWMEYDLEEPELEEEEEEE
jgi:hypothetical protein